MHFRQCWIDTIRGVPVRVIVEARSGDAVEHGFETGEDEADLPGRERDTLSG
jgi:hypothetical protein